MQVGEDATITDEVVNKFIIDKEVMHTSNDRFIIVKAILATGEEIVEALPDKTFIGMPSIADDEVCMLEIKNRVKACLEFMLKAAINGVTNKKK